MTPDAQSLRYFLAVAEERNFTHAAALLGIAQPALSAHIRRLEDGLGVKLLERTTRHVSLTPAGEVLLERGPALLRSFDALWDLARRTGSGELGTLRLAYSTSVGNETVPTLVAALGAQVPGMRVEAAVMATPAIGPAVARGDLDAGLTRRAQGASGTRDILLRLETGGAILSTGHPLARRRRLTLRDLAAFPVMLHVRDANPANHDAIVALFADAGLTPRFFQPPVPYDISQSTVRTTDAVGLVGRSALSTAPPGTKWIPLRESAAAIGTYLVLPTGTLSPAQRQLETTAAALAKTEGWLGEKRRDP